LTFKGLDKKFRTKEIQDILPDFKLGDNASKIFTAKRLEEFRKMNFPIAEEIKEMGYAKIAVSLACKSALDMNFSFTLFIKNVLSSVFVIYKYTPNKIDIDDIITISVCALLNFCISSLYSSSHEPPGQCFDFSLNIKLYNIQPKHTENAESNNNKNKHPIHTITLIPAACGSIIR